MNSDERLRKMLEIVDERIRLVEEAERIRRRSFFLSQLFHSLWEDERDDQEQDAG